MFEYAKWFNKLPSDKEDINENNLRLFFSTMYERQIIWKRRFIENKNRPWTNNPILRDSKFTNVYRELDRNSQWLIKNIILDDKLSLKNLIWKMMVFRFFNNPETFMFEPKQIVTEPSLFPVKVKNNLISSKKWRNGIPDFEEYNEDEFSEFITGIRSTGKNPYTSAYLINSMATPGKPRDYCYTHLVIPTLHSKIPELIKVVLTAKEPEDVINYLKTLPSVADFIAHEFYQDFTYISRYTDRKFMKFNQNDYTNVGPGASMGIRLIFPSLSTREQKKGIYELRRISAVYLNDIEKTENESFPYLHWDKENKKYFVNDSYDLSLHQIEMWLCEFQKYWKMTIGEGKQRSKFIPRTITL